MLSWSALLKKKKSVSLIQSLLVPSADVKGAFLSYMLLSNFRGWEGRKVIWLGLFMLLSGELLLLPVEVELFTSVPVAVGWSGFTVGTNVDEQTTASALSTA